MRVKLAPASLALVTDPARNGAGVLPGDVLEFVMSARVENDTAGPSAYLTAYFVDGVEILGAWFVTDQTGLTPRAPGAGGHGHDGWGPRGDQSPFGAPFTGAGTGRQNDLFGDTGIFFSSDLRTKFNTDTPDNVLIGPTVGSPAGTSSLSNGYNVNDTFFGDIDAFNLWDADQVNAYGTGGVINSVPNNPAPTSSSTIINAKGQGATPFNSGSPVAGPQSGYQLDNTGAIGPWQRIQYQGSQVADISDGPATGVGVADTPDQMDASSLGVSLNGAGYAINDSTMLPGNINAIRWSDGLVYDNQTIYVKVRVRVTDTALAAADGVISNFEANGSDNWASGSKDNPWRYFGPSVPVYESPDIFVSKRIVSYNDINYIEGPLPAGAQLKYQLSYFNQVFIPVEQTLLQDVLPSVIATAGCSPANPTLSIETTGVSVAVSSGTASCPDPGATLVFSNLPNVTNNKLKGLRGGSVTYTLKLEDTLATGTAISNTGTFSATAVGGGAPLSSSSTVNSVVGEPLPPVSIDKSVSDLNGGDVEPGDVLRYTVSINNTLNATSDNLTLTDSLPSLVENFSMVSLPVGATFTFDPPPGGANASGQLQVSSIAVAPSSTEFISFDVNVVDTAGTGSSIDNIAELNNPSGTGHSASISSIVNESLTFANGIKPLYLYDTGELSRAPLAANTNKIRINKNGNAAQWILQPITTGELTFSPGTVPVYLWLKGRKKSEDFSVSVQLSAVGATTTLIGPAVTETVSLDKNNPALFRFNIDLPTGASLQAGSQVQLTVTNNHDEDLELIPRIGTHSRVEPELTTVIHVNSVQTLGDAFPAGEIKTTWLPEETMYIRSLVTDPFGSADISGATILITDPSGSVVVGPTAIAEVSTDAGSKTYEYQYALPSDAQLGSWNITVVAEEGTENTVTHTAVANFTVSNLQISGYVFNDENVNGQFDTQESGLSPVVVVLRNDASGLCSSTTTSAAGYYQFASLEAGAYTLYESANETLPLPEDCPPTTASLSGYLSLIGNTQTVDLASAAITDANFPNVRKPELTTDGKLSTTPGGFVILPHAFKAYADGTVDIAITQPIATPVTPAWPAELYQDIDCDQTLDSVDTTLSASISIAANEQICMLAKVFTPSNVPAGARYSHTIQATYSFSDPNGLNHNLTSAADRADIVIVSDTNNGVLQLEKDVQNLTLNGQRGLDNTALPSHALRYTLTYENIGAGLLSDLVVFDYVPAFTKLDTPVTCPVSLPQGLTACAVVLPESDANINGYVGPIEWKFTGSLAAGASGELEIGVVVD